MPDPVEGSPDRPVSLDPFQRIVEVGWAGGYALVTAETGGDGALTISLSADGGPVVPRIDPMFISVEPAQSTDPTFDTGFVFNAVELKKYRIARSAVGDLETRNVASPTDIVGWTDTLEYYPRFDTGSTIGVWDQCRSPDDGHYIGDDHCVFERGGAVPFGGVPRHLHIADILDEYTSDPLKRVRFSRVGSKDKRFYYIEDDPMKPPLAPDFSLFKTERAVVSSPIYQEIRLVNWLVNFSFTPASRVITATVEEPGSGGDFPTSSLKLQIFPEGPFSIVAAPNGGQKTFYNGTKSPRYSRTIKPIKWGPDGIVAKFNRRGFV